MEVLFDKILAGDRLALAKAITLVESSNPIHQEKASFLIDKAIQLKKTSIRIGITGVPGVGKSTFIDSFGTWLVTEKQKKVCVLAIDPSSQKNHGSILGDKTRMEHLSMLDDVFIRPSPASGHLGGIAKKTREAIILCEAAGYDVSLIETVGVGQNEYVADNVVDCLLLLLLPNAGDELQGIKRGIMELADIVVLNKADVTEPTILNQSLSDLKNAIHFLPNKYKGWHPSILKHAMQNKKDVEIIWHHIENFIAFQRAEGNFDLKRISQKKDWLIEAIRDKLEFDFFNDASVIDSLNNSIESWDNGTKGINEISKDLIKGWKESKS